MRKTLLALWLLLCTLVTTNAQVVFDPDTYNPADLPTGMSIVDIEGTNYLQVVLDGWNSFLALDPVTVSQATHFTCMAKYAVGTSGYTLDQINTFLKLANGDFSVEIGAAGAASSATFIEYTVDVTNQGTIANLQVAGQETVGWSAVIGDTLWVGKVTVFPYTPPTLIETVLTRETFGSTNWDTDGPGGGPGHPTHWDWDAITTWTSWNGHIEGGSDSSYRINSYDSGWPIPEYWREPGGMHHAHMAIRDGDSYVGSWDTTYYMGIDISDADPVTAIEFGYVRARTVAAEDTFHRSLNVEFRINGGSWVQADTTLIVPENVYLRWDYIVMPVDFKGAVLDLRFSCLQTNEQVYLDDISVVGMAPEPQGTNDFSIANIVFGTVDDGADYTGNLHMSWDADSVYMLFALADDSIVNNGNSYQCDNFEIYFDMDNSKNVHWPRNGGWMANDPTYDENDYQLRLVPDVDWATNNGLEGARQAYAVTDTGYNYILNIVWDSLLVDFDAVEGTLIGFDVLISDADDAANVNDANRNQITLNSPTDKPFNDPSLFATFEFKAEGRFEIIPDEEAPEAPGNFAGVNDSATVTLSWDLAVDNIAVMSYNVYTGSTLLENVLAREDGNEYVVDELAEATYSFGVETIDNYGNISSKSSIYVDVVYPSAIELTEGEQFRIYPNPAHSDLYILSAETIDRIQIISITGTVVTDITNVDVVNVADLEEGLYLVKVQTSSGVYSETFVKE